jgi:hypothetical protein
VTTWDSGDTATTGAFEGARRAAVSPPADANTSRTTAPGGASRRGNAELLTDDGPRPQEAPRPASLHVTCDHHPPSAMPASVPIPASVPVPASVSVPASVPPSGDARGQKPFIV